MKRAIISATLAIVLVGFAVGLCGCSAEQMGETTAEGSQRHARVLRLNKQQMTSDIDTLFHMDRPSQLTELTIP